MIQLSLALTPFRMMLTLVLFGFRFQIKMTSRRPGGGDAGVHFKYSEEHPDAADNDAA